MYGKHFRSYKYIFFTDHCTLNITYVSGIIETNYLQNYLAAWFDNNLNDKF